MRWWQRTQPPKRYKVLEQPGPDLYVMEFNQAHLNSYRANPTAFVLVAGHLRSTRLIGHLYSRSIFTPEGLVVVGSRHYCWGYESYSYGVTIMTSTPHYIGYLPYPPGKNTIYWDVEEAYQYLLRSVITRTYHFRMYI